MTKWEILTFMMGGVSTFFGLVHLLTRNEANQKPTAIEIAGFVLGIALLCVWASI